MLSNFISWNFFRAILTLVAVIAVFGVLIWLLERKRNPEMFETDARRGLMSGFWWSAVTMTTVGYGDKSPVTGLGRLLAVVWMFASIITISGLTATIAASLTTQQLESRVRGPEDLPNVRVGAKQGESPAQILRDMKIEPTEFDTIQQGLNAVKLGVIDAFVHDVPVMQAEIKEDSELGESVLVLHRTIQDEEYGIAVHRADPTRRNLRREQINESLLDLKISGTYGEIVEKYLGSGG